MLVYQRVITLLWLGISLLVFSSRVVHSESLQMAYNRSVDGRNPAPPNGWLKPIQNNGMFTTYQLVIRISSIHSMSTVKGEVIPSILTRTGPESMDLRLKLLQA